eukprot:TRINITY_DN1613_c1_g1_i5.p1 TRINITY_DN1613_c1_g1~~TRINITY_DN1613_c1_g1_i5.p1  ORF type:complete len:736 (+),score=270.34 TRINITY_DN1613_c1_g1_i5:87-2210(+)
MMSVSVLALAAAGLPRPVPTQPPSNFDSLNKVLENLELAPPDMKLSIHNGTVALRSVHCSGFSLGDLSLPAAPLSGGGSEAAVVLSKMNLSCSADIDEAIPPLPSAKNNSITFAASLDVELIAALLPSAPGSSAAPTNVSLEGCSAAMPALTAHCKPVLSPLCVFINTALPGIVKALLNTTVCTVLRKEVAPAGKIGSLVNEVGGLLAVLAESPEPKELKPKETERYLKPFDSELAKWSKHGKLARLAGLVDFMPTKMIDFVIWVVTRGGRLNIPLNVAVPVQLPLDAGNLTVGITSLKMTGLNQFKTLRPAKLESAFTWRSKIAIKKASVTVGVKVALSPGSTIKGLPKDAEVDLQVHVPVTDLSVDLSAIVAFNETRLCGLNTKAVLSSGQCLVWPIAHAASAAGPVSGLNVTYLDLSLGDVSTSVVGLGPGIDNVIEGALEEFSLAYKPALLAALPRGLSTILQSVMNTEIYKEVGKMQEEGSCSAVSEAPQASRVCVVNNAWFLMKYGVHGCESGMSSASSGMFGTGKHRCMELSGIQNVSDGETVRVALNAVAGRREMADTAVRYQPNSNVATYTCRGISLDYKCKLQSVMPISGSMPEVSKVCVTNDALFYLRWEAKDRKNGKTSASSGRYGAHHTRCIDLSTIPGVAEGDEVEGTVHAVMGKRKSLSTRVVYKNTTHGATFVCRGASLWYHCDLLVTEMA